MNAEGNISSLILGLLGILFVGLKLTGHIDWSWWWVLLPFYGGLGIAVVIMLVGFVFYAVKRVKN